MTSCLNPGQLSWPLAPLAIARVPQGKFVNKAAESNTTVSMFVLGSE